MVARRNVLARTVRPEQLSDLGKTIASNRGGYQSLSNIFDAWSEAQTGTRWPLAADSSAQQQSHHARRDKSLGPGIDDPKEAAGQPQGFVFTPHQAST